MGGGAVGRDRLRGVRLHEEGTSATGGTGEPLPADEERDGMRTTWFTGLPCSGKTALARAFVARLNETANPSWPHVHLDGDDVRRGLNS